MDQQTYNEINTLKDDIHSLRIKLEDAMREIGHLKNAIRRLEKVIIP